MTSFPIHLTDSLPFLKRLFDFLPVPIILSHYDGDLAIHLHLNKKFGEIIGYTLDEIPTMREWYKQAYAEPEEQETMIREWNRRTHRMYAIGSEFIEPIRACVRCKDGKKRWFEIESGVWIDTIALTTFVDIDDLTRQREHLEQLNSAKDKLFSIISHDFRAPLARLQQVLAQVETDPSQVTKFFDYLPVINHQLTQVYLILDNLLVWASAQLMHREPRPMRIDFLHIIESSLSLLQGQWQQKKIQLSLEERQPVLVWVDYDMINIALRNIINNAIKFTPAGKSIYVRYYVQPPFAYVDVTDTGIGMPADLVHRILRREIGSTRPGTADEKGTGLGLAFSQEMIEANGGTFHLKSVENEGSVVGFSIPLAK
ncbi:PAS domain-containing sensor histidine kinase [Spirosoma montaniterrae]|uniref:histidine kinase n=1 Tax=Spirosoma montaniterrae TaxID=1178516 RepID=A0A1P9X0I4_9BACT|nr:PAS domain-containing sensor histidine kinase [Spirosoma montaniterrae]AQG81095.1 hypothetical protein AWR27_18270 [Spirosoma montaniterrae]